MTNLAPTAERRSTLETAQLVLVAIAIVLIPVAVQYGVQISVHSPHMRRTLMGATVVSPLDLVLAGLAVAAIPLVFRRATVSWRSAGVFGLAVLTAVAALWGVVGPTDEGVILVIRLAGAVGAAAVISSASPRAFRLFVLWPLVFGIITQAVLGLVQVLVLETGHYAGITQLWEGSWGQGYGTFDGAYALAAFLTLAIAVLLASMVFEPLHPIMWAAVVVGSAGVVVTFGRAGALSIVLVAVTYFLGAIVRRSRPMLAGWASITIPVATVGLITRSAWFARAEQTAAGDQTKRDTLMDRAFDVIQSDPWTGVGPAQMAPALRRLGLQEIDWTYVHNVPILVTAEYGIAIGILFAAWLLAIGVRAFLTSFQAAAVALAILPYLLFDNLHLIYTYGIALFAIWVGVLDLLARTKRHETLGTPELAAAPESADVTSTV